MIPSQECYSLDPLPYFHLDNVFAVGRMTDLRWWCSPFWAPCALSHDPLQKPSSRRVGKISSATRLDTITRMSFLDPPLFPSRQWIRGWSNDRQTLMMFTFLVVPYPKIPYKSNLAADLEIPSEQSVIPSQECCRIFSFPCNPTTSSWLVEWQTDWCWCRYTLWTPCNWSVDPLQKQTWRFH